VSAGIYIFLINQLWGWFTMHDPPPIGSIQIDHSSEVGAMDNLYPTPQQAGIRIPSHLMKDRFCAGFNHGLSYMKAFAPSLHHCCSVTQVLVPDDQRLAITGKLFGVPAAVGITT
jgi:hypothetical protein